MNDRSYRGAWPIVPPASAAPGRAWRWLLPVPVALALLTPPAQAASKAECLAAHEKGQELRDAGRLREAREAFLVCAQSSCPAAAQNECVPWLRDTETMTPSLVVGARAADGRDVVAARLLVDGQPVAEKLDGTPVTVDPGVHQVRVETPDDHAEQSVVVRQGEKNRLVTLSFAAPLAPPPPASASASSVAVTTASTPVAAWVATGVGVAALGAFAYLGLSARSRLDDLRHTCSPRCSDDEVDPVRTRALAADISLGVSVVALGVATYLWLSPRSTPAPVARALSTHLGASPRPGGGALSWGWSF